jgi:hypothetical protein
VQLAARLRSTSHEAAVFIKETKLGEFQKNTMLALCHFGHSATPSANKYSAEIKNRFTPKIQPPQNFFRDQPGAFI